MDDRYVNIHTHRRTGTGIEVVSVMAGTAGSVGTAEKMWMGTLPKPPFSIGVHPWQIGEGHGAEGGAENGAKNEDGNGVRLDDAGLTEALREIEAARAWAIGEVGLDYAIEADRDRQRAVFVAQLRIAEKRRLPVILHCVRAFEPTMEILAGYRLPAVIFHGFVGSPEQAVRAMRAGYYISFGERSLSSPKTVEALRNVPPDRLFLETDDSPTPIGEIYARAAAILDTPRETLVQKILENYERLVGTH